MSGPLLITSFRAWRSHQRSNSSHDLIAAMVRAGQLPENAVWLAQLPVNFQTAPMVAINEMYRIRPRAVVCCGMAENRSYLSLERRAKVRKRAGLDYLQTDLDLADLLAGTWLSEISDDAGDYVCNWLYYSVLAAAKQGLVGTSCLFVHVPALTPQTQRLVQTDLSAVLEKLSR